jgi:hypothetical protein
MSPGPLETAEHGAMNVKILAALDRMRRNAPPPVTGQGWQSDRGRQELPEFQDVVACVNRATKTVMAFLRIGYDACQITGCWANVNPPGALHRMHSHPNNFL